MAYTFLMDMPDRERILNEVVETISEGVYFIDLDGRITFWNKGAERITGYLRSETVGKKCSESLLRHVDAAGCELCVNGCPLASVMTEGVPKETEVFLHHKDGHRVPVDVRASPITGPDVRPIGAIEVFSDRSERSSLIAELEALKQEVLKDALTGLGNRRYAELSAASAMRDSAAEGGSFGALMIDIDRFKNVNDQHGHLVGSKLLWMIGDAIKGHLRMIDYAFRYGGDEFVVVLPACSKAEAIVHSNDLRRAVQRAAPVLAGLPFPAGALTVSVGVAQLDPARGWEEMIKRADAAMYEAKTGGRNGYRKYSSRTAMSNQTSGPVNTSGPKSSVTVNNPFDTGTAALVSRTLTRVPLVTVS